MTRRTDTSMLNQALTECQRQALGEFMPLLGLEDSGELLIIDLIALCDRFYSFPFASRTNVQAIGKQLDLIELGVLALSRSQVKTTVANSVLLQTRIDEIQLRLESLLSGGAQ